MSLRASYFALLALALLIAAQAGGGLGLMSKAGANASIAAPAIDVTQIAQAKG